MVLACLVIRPRRAQDIRASHGGHADVAALYLRSAFRLFLHGDRLAVRYPHLRGRVGVLAGDTLRSAADLEIPMVAVTLVSSAGYFRQELDEQGRQRELPDA